MLTPQKSLIF